VGKKAGFHFRSFRFQNSPFLIFRKREDFQQTQTTDQEMGDKSMDEARKAMIEKRFGGNTKGASTGGGGSVRRKKKAAHKSSGGMQPISVHFDLLTAAQMTKNLEVF
jgi:hypothetical protein